MENLSAQTIIEIVGFAVLLFLTFRFANLWRLKTNTLSKVLLASKREQKEMTDLFFRWQEELEQERQLRGQQGLEVTLSFSNHFKEMRNTIQDDLILPEPRLKKFNEIFVNMNLLENEVRDIGELNAFVSDVKSQLLLKMLTEFRDKINGGYKTLEMDVTLQNPELKLPDAFQAGILRLLFKLTQFSMEATGSTKTSISIHQDVKAFYVFYRNSEVIYNTHLLGPIVSMANSLTTSGNIQISHEGLQVYFPIQFIKIFLNK